MQSLISKAIQQQQSAAIEQLSNSSVKANGGGLTSVHVPPKVKQLWVNTREYVPAGRPNRQPPWIKDKNDDNSLNVD